MRSPLRAHRERRLVRVYGRARIRKSFSPCKRNNATAAAGCLAAAAAVAKKKTGHVCRQQINENKVARSSYSGAPAERSASIYTTQCSDLIWETDLHPPTRTRESERRGAGRRGEDKTHTVEEKRERRTEARGRGRDDVYPGLFCVQLFLAARRRRIGRDESNPMTHNED